MLRSIPGAAEAYRVLRVLARRRAGIEPRVKVAARLPLEVHGNAAGGWCIGRDSLSERSVVVDVGIGEDASFPASIIRKYGCAVSGFDPTPRAIEYVRSLANERLKLFELALGVREGTARFFLPNNEAHVSGSLTKEGHLGNRQIEVPTVTLPHIFRLLGCARIDLLKLDIEGTEYDVIESPDFRKSAPLVGQLCVEFHHRWNARGKRSTEQAVEVLEELGFRCAWYCRSTNEEFLFVNTGWTIPGASAPGGSPRR